MSDGNWVPRRSERLRITYFARCKSPADHEREIVIVNITPEGCCITVNSAAIRPGQHILIRLESDEVLTGMVRWVRNGQAGILFDEYLDRDRLEYLRREHSTFLSEVDQTQASVPRSVI